MSFARPNLPVLIREIETLVETFDSRRADFRRILDKAGSEPPREGDELPE